jgi:hypothetical protein
VGPEQTFQGRQLDDPSDVAADEAWSRSAVVAGAGKAVERNVFWYAHGLATHERSHLSRLGRLRRGSSA